MPLDELAKGGRRQAPTTFFPGAWDSANYDGKLWGIPFNVDVWQFSFYNNDLLKAAGVDPASVATFEGLKAAGEKLTDAAKGKFGIGLFGHKGEDTVVVLDSFIFSNGGKVLNDDGTCGLTSDASVGALAYLAVARALRAAGHPQRRFGRHARAVPQRLAGDRVLAGAGAADAAEVEASTGTSSSAPRPRARPPIGTYGGWNLVIYANSPNKEAAWKFIQFLTREDVNGEVVDLIPANVKAAKAFLEANRKGPDRIMEHLNNAAPRPLSPRYLEVSDIQVTLAQDVFAALTRRRPRKRPARRSTR